MATRCCRGPNPGFGLSSHRGDGCRQIYAFRNAFIHITGQNGDYYLTFEHFGGGPGASDYLLSLTQVLIDKKAVRFAKMGMKAIVVNGDTYSKVIHQVHRIFTIFNSIQLIIVIETGKTSV